MNGSQFIGCMGREWWIEKKKTVIIHTGLGHCFNSPFILLGLLYLVTCSDQVCFQLIVG